MLEWSESVHLVVAGHDIQRSFLHFCDCYKKSTGYCISRVKLMMPHQQQLHHHNHHQSHYQQNHHHGHQNQNKNNGHFSVNNRLHQFNGVGGHNAHNHRYTDDMQSKMVARLAWQKKTYTFMLVDY